MQLPEMFDPSTVAPATGSTGQLPVSDKSGHVVVISNGEMKQTQDGTGQYLALTLRVVEGPATGSEGIHRLNIHNQSADAVRIAYSELSAICYCIGHIQPLQDLTVLYERPFRVVVGLQKNQEANGYTEVKKILDIHGNRAGNTSPVEAPSAAPAPAPATPAPAPAAPPAPAPAAPVNPAAAPWAQS